MKSYLERAQEHDDFMQTQNLEYQIGKRHLANMMGEDPEMFTQEDVDVSSIFLFNKKHFSKLNFFRDLSSICFHLEFMIKEQDL